MKVICDGSALLSAATKVSSAISTKTTSQVLECIKLKTEGENLILSATDTEIAIIQSLHADILVNGEAVVPGRYFVDLIKNIGSGHIQLFLESPEKINISYGDNEFSLQCNAKDDFPDINPISKQNSITMTQGEFCDMVAKTSFCVSTEDSRPVLKGCSLKVYGDMLRCVALDGYRLALCDKELIGKPSNIDAIVPVRALKEIARLHEKDEAFFNICFDDKKIMVKAEYTTFISKLIEGEFIRYENIIPKDFETIGVINKKDLDASLDRASILTRGIRTNIVTFDLANSILTISTKSEIGKINEQIKINHDGEKIKINFNPKYFTDITKILSDEFIKVKFNKNNMPAIVTGVDKEDFLFMVLPVRTIS